jgi:hypothetical protein
MSRLQGYATVGLLAAGLLIAWPSTSTAQDRVLRYQRVDQAAYENGYRGGLAQGERDARDGREFSFTRAEEYRLADLGYRRQDGDLQEYRQMFRRGFEAGYRDGFEHESRAIVPYRSGRAELSPAAQIGFEDGFEAGLNDVRHHERYDPVRNSRYRSADHHYDRRYGTREEFMREYRNGFEEGYDQAFGSVSLGSPPSMEDTARHTAPKHVPRWVVVLSGIFGDFSFRRRIHIALVGRVGL